MLVSVAKCRTEQSFYLAVIPAPAQDHAYPEFVLPEQAWWPSVRQCCPFCSIKAKGVFLGGVFVQATIIYVQASVSQCWQAVSTLHYIQDTGLHYRPVRASVGKQCSVGQNSR